MSKPPRLARAVSANSSSKLPSSRRKMPALVAKVPATGTKTGRERTHAKGDQEQEQEEESQPKSKANPSRGAGTMGSQQPEFPKGNLKVTSSEDAENLRCKQASAGTVSCASGSGARGHAKSSRGALPRRHTVGGPRSSQEILAMQPSVMDKKREAFLEHLKQKYPNHASAIMGHQERLREQNRSARAGVACPSPVPAFVDQPEQSSLASLDALEVMSECDMPVAFTRGSRSRASLPVVRSANQTKDSSLGVLYLQYGDDTKQIRMPNEITSVDTVRALFVSAFPQQLSMKMLESPSTAIYVKDDMRNMYYELSDVRGITDQSCLKVYHKDPAQAFSHAARPSNGDARMHRELMYASRDAPPLMRQPSQGAPAPPNPHSMPSSPSRIPFGPRSSGSGATIPRERPGHPLATPTRSASPCPSAILERRDVKPDEDLAAKGLVRGGEALYGDPFMLHHHAPPPETLDLAYHRAAIRTYGVPGMPMEPVDHHSLFRQKSWKTPPSSPHRMGDMRMMEIHASQAQGTLGLERSSPIRQSFRKDGPVAVDKGRSAMGSPVTPDLQAHGNLVTPADPQTRERMRAMEEQIASLTGLVQHALLKGPSNSRGDRENASDISVKSGSPVHSTSSTGGSPVLGPKIGTIVPDSGPAQTPPMHSTPLQVNLHHFRKNVSELRFQLQKMRQLQLQNQEFVHAQIKQAAQEINLRLVEALKRQEDPSHRQRVLVEEERHKYLNMEEKVLEQLGDLERYVESLKKDSTPRAVMLKEVEEGAVGLRKVGESLAGLKGEFPGLQTRMRAVLRVEVEAVKFLKEEPHKLDSMLKRVKTLTDALSTLRKCATEGLAKPSDPVSNTTADEVRPVAPAEFHDPVTFLEPQNSSVRSEAVSSSPGLIHRTQSSSVPSRQSQQTSRPSPTPESATKQSGNTEKSISAQPEHGTAPSSSSNGVSLNKACRNGAYSVGGHDGVTSPSLFIEEIMSHSKKKNRATSIEAAEREWEDRRQNLGHYDSQEFERMLQEAEANMLRGIPSLEVPDKSPSLPVPTTMPPVAREELVEKPKYSAPAIQDDKQPAAPSSDKSTKTEKASKSHHPTEKPAKSAVLDRHLKPNLTNKTSLDRGAKAQDKAAKLNQGSEKANKSPPPPPPRKNYTTPTGMTTTRSGDVVYTSRRESGSAQEGEADAAASAPQPKPKSSPEVKPKPCTPPVTTSAMVEEDDEGDKIMAELQVFQKCSVKDIGGKGLVEPQIKELRPGVLLPLKDKKHNTEIQENKDLVTDETGNSMVRKTPGVIYYVTAQISKEPPEDSTDHRATSHSSASQVSHVNASDKSQNQQQVSTDGPSDIPDKGNVSSDLPYKPFTRSSSLKSKTQSPTEGPGSPTQGKVQVFKVPQVQVSIQERVESPTSICSPVSLGGPDLNYSQATVNSSEQSSANQKPVVSSSKIRERQYKEVEDENETFLSPDLSGEEPPPPPPDNIAFMITNTKVQALSTGEYQELVNAKKGNVQTVTVGSRPQTNRGSDSNAGNVGNSNGLVDAEASGYSKKPVIIIFDEPMDIRSAYKRLSTIFECEEELERMLAEERIEEESEENEEDEIRNAKQEGDKRDSRKPESASRSILSSSLASEGGILTEDARHDVKKKSKFKFPTKQLAALTQAIRNGTKTGKKTLQVVVYEDEEESDGSIKQHKETKRFEIASKQEAVKPEPVAQETHGRTEEIRKSTYKTLDSLEQTIRQLESTINEMGPRPSEDLQAPEQSKTQDVQGAEDKVNPPKTLVQKPSSSSKRPGLRKKPKPQLLPRPAVIPTKGVSVAPAAPQQNASVASPTSRMPVPVSAKARQQPGTTDRERATKQQKLQDSQRQFRQANGSAKRSGGDPKSTSPTMPASKIPAFSSGKGASQSDATNHVNHSSSSCSSSSSSSPSKSSIPTPRSLPVPSSHMASLSNGSVKLTPPTHTTKALSLSTQSQNGRPSSSFSSSSHPPLSPTMLSQGAKSVRTIHTPSFVSYNRPHNGSAGKSAIPTATVAKETSQNA